VTWSEMNATQRVTCVVLLLPALAAYGLTWVIIEVTEFVGLT
jgi:hypothetical protein